MGARAHTWPEGAREDRADAAASSAAGWAGDALGLHLSGDFAAPGFPCHFGEDSELPPVHSTVIGEDSVRDLWDAPDAQRLLDWRYSNGRQMQSVEHHPEAGFRLYGAGHGTHLIAPDGTQVWSAPGEAEPWVWQRYLVGQVLPLAALLHGYEILHASSVALAGRGVAFLADSGVGKTSIAANLIRRGARLLADDVTVLGLDGERALVHPGIGLINLRGHEEQRIGTACAEVGQTIGRTSQGVRLAVPRQSAALSLDVMYLLQRGAPETQPRFQRLSDAAFQLLVANTFAQHFTGADRWARQLEVFAVVAHQVAAYRLHIPETMSAAELARHIESHVTNEQSA